MNTKIVHYPIILPDMTNSASFYPNYLSLYILTRKRNGFLNVYLFDYQNYTQYNSTSTSPECGAYFGKQLNDNKLTY